MILLLGFLSSFAFAQTEAAISGTVGAKDGQPIAGVQVYGSPGKCCPSKPEETKTDNDGVFRLEHPGAVIHLSKEGLQPLAVVVKPSSSPLRIVLRPATDNLAVPVCGKPGRGQMVIAWMQYGVRFLVPKRSFQILGGKPDVDYVKYVIKPKGSDGVLQFWFGPYAISLQPNDDQFINSSDFTQRYLVDRDGGTMGVDSSGRLANGQIWRQTVAFGGGAVYHDASAEDARQFDQIINALCEVPYPKP